MNTFICLHWKENSMRRGTLPVLFNVGYLPWLAIEPVVLRMLLAESNRLFD
jgi:hypothetical protein